MNRVPITQWQRQVARVYQVPLWILDPRLTHPRAKHTAYSRRLRARRRRRRG